MGSPSPRMALLRLLLLFSLSDSGLSSPAATKPLSSAPRSLLPRHRWRPFIHSSTRAGRSTELSSYGAGRGIRRGLAPRRARYALTPESVDKLADEIDEIMASYDFTAGVRSLGNTAAQNWLDDLEKLGKKASVSAPMLKDLRKEGAEDLHQLELPYKKIEAYRFLNLRRFYGKKFGAATGEVSARVLQDTLQEETQDFRQVFVDGVYNSELSVEKDELPEGAYVGSIKDLPEDFHDEVKKELGIVAEDKYGSKFFAALNKANLQDVSVIALKEGVSLPKPLQLTFYSSKAKMKRKASASFPRIVILAGKESKGSIYVNHVGDSGTDAFSCPVTTVKVGDDADFSLHYQQQHSEYTVHAEAMNVTVMDRGKFTWKGFLNGGSVGRLNLAIDLKGADAEVEVLGASLATEGKQLDIHTFIRHLGERGVSKQEHRSIVGAKAEGIFRGQIYITKEAYDCDADQQSRALLLSSTGEVNAMPTLVVEPDRVEGAAHGSTVSDLQGEEMFYMLCRGLDEETAKTMLTKGFIRHIIQEFPFENMKTRLMDQIADIAHSATVQWRFTDLDGTSNFDKVMGRDEEMSMF